MAPATTIPIARRRARAAQRFGATSHHSTRPGLVGVPSSA
jgi:hypothetical protein